MLDKLRQYAGNKQIENGSEVVSMNPAYTDQPFALFKGRGATKSLVLLEAELILARSQLTGDEVFDRYTNERMTDLESEVCDLNQRLKEKN